MAKRWWLLIILLLALFFRTYNFEKSFSFAHDQDLYSWIAKDIVVNKHLRLAGQVTSVDGVFIGPAYYYLMALSYWIFGMNPMGAMPVVTIIGLLTVWSFYYVVKKFYGQKCGLIASFIYAVSIGTAFFDRWSVPTQPTVLWSIWFVYVILDLYSGNKKSIPIYALLVGLVWNVHIALLPILPIPFISYLIGNKVKNKFDKSFWKLVIISIIIFLISCSPFFIFEIKYNFSQIKSTIVAMKKELGGPTGMIKLKKVLNASGREMQQRMVWGYDNFSVEIFWIIWFVLEVLAYKSKKIGGGEIGLLNLWVFLIILAQYTSKRQVSEYYFTNLLPIFVVFLALCLDALNAKMLLVLAIIYLIINGWWLVKRSDIDHSYFYRRQLVEYISKKVKEKGYPCISINYIADFGVGVGFRYLFWYNGIKVVKADSEVMGYDIVIPYSTSENEISKRFGRFGVIEHEDLSEINYEKCNDKGLELEPLLGYTE